MISLLLAAEAAAQLVQVSVLVALVETLWMLLHVSQRLLVIFVLT